MKLILALLLAASPASAQSADDPPAASQAVAGESAGDAREVLPFLDASFVGFAWANHEVTFDGDIVPNFVIFETLFKGLGKAYKASAPDRRPHVSYGLTFVPMVRLRMFIQEPSAPVRTPSYMPKLTFQTLVFQRGSAADTLHLYGLQTTLGHYSNGQDGCLFLTETEVSKGNCVDPAGGITPSSPVNRLTGSFSTNYLQFGFRYRRVRLIGPDAAPVRESDRDLTVGADVELNPGHFFGSGGIAPDQNALYGPTRITGIAGGAWHNHVCNRLEGRVSIKYLHGQLADGVPPFAETLEGTCLVTKNGWGAMVRFYHGQDYYNLGFTDNVTRFQAGLTYSQEGFMKFRLRD